MKERNSIGIFIAIVVMAVMLLGVLAYDPPEPPEDPDTNFPFEDVDPEDYEGMNFATEAAALERANFILGGFLEGEIEEIDDTDNLNISLVLYRVFGDKIYWDVSDSDTSARVDPYTGEVVMYFNAVWSDGPMNEGQIRDLADDIVENFSPKPNDAGYPTAVYEPLWVDEGFNGESWSTSTARLWKVRYNRTKDGIPTGDSIILNINGDGTVAFYCKNWNMDLDPPFIPTFEVTQQEAEDIATAGDPNSTVRNIFLEIVRPNNFWNEGGFTYNSTARAVWTVWVERVDYHPGFLYIFHIDGMTGEIVGGDMGEDYYT